MTIDERITKSIEEKLLPIKINFAEEKFNDGTEKQSLTVLYGELLKKFKETKGEYFPEIDVPFTREAITDDSIRFAYLTAYNDYCFPDEYN